MSFQTVRLAGLIFFGWVLLKGQTVPADGPKMATASGVVIDGKSGEPVRKSVVILRPISAPAMPAMVTAGQHSGIGTTTDAAGKFLLHDIEPGTYKMWAERDGYVTPSPSSGQIVSFEAGVEKSDLKLKLLRTGSVSGRVLDSDGEPVMNASVRFQSWKKSQHTGAQRGFSATTNDRGEYRIFNVAPGQYRLLVSYAPPASQRMDIRMQTVRTSAEGAAGYPNLYYPNSTTREQASAVTVEAGSELQGFDFQLRKQHAVTVQGRVVGLGAGAGQPLSVAFVSLVEVGQEGAPTHDTIVQDPAGDFEFPHVLPGTYRLSGARVGFAANGTGETNSLTAERILQIDDAGVKGIQLILAAPIRVSGRMVAPQGRALPTGFTILMEKRENGEGQPSSFATVAADGSFALDNLPPGNYSVSIGSTNQQADDSYISEIRLGDTDALTEGFSLTATPPAPLEIRLKANGGTLESEVKDEKASAVPAAQVWLVPDAPKQQQFALYGDCRTDSKSSCRITGITPGKYHAYAFASDIVLDRRDPDAFKAFEKYGKPVEFEEGQKQRIELLAASVE